MIKKLSKTLKSKNLLKTSMLTLCFLALAINVYAVDDPKIVTGTLNLFTKLTTWLLILIPASAGAFLGYHAWQKALATEQAVIAEKNKLMKNVLLGAIIAETAGSIIRVVLGFYQ